MEVERGREGGRKEGRNNNSRTWIPAWASWKLYQQQKRHMYVHELSFIPTCISITLNTHTPFTHTMIHTHTCNTKYVIIHSL